MSFGWDDSPRCDSGNPPLSLTAKVGGRGRWGCRRSAGRPAARQQLGDGRHSTAPADPDGHLPEPCFLVGAPLPAPGGQFSTGLDTLGRSAQGCCHHAKAKAPRRDRTGAFPDRLERRRAQSTGPIRSAAGPLTRRSRSTGPTVPSEGGRRRMGRRRAGPCRCRTPTQDLALRQPRYGRFR